MKIQIEDYFGNDVVKLDFCLRDKQISIDTQMVVDTLATTEGYNVADVDEGEDGIPVIRVQQGNVDCSESEEKGALVGLIQKLNVFFL